MEDNFLRKKTIYHCPQCFITTNLRKCPYCGQKSVPILHVTRKKVRMEDFAMGITSLREKK